MSRTQTHARPWFALAACLTLAANASAQNAPDGTANVPDLSGNWMISFDEIPPRREPTPLEQSMLDQLSPGAVLLADSGLVDFPPGDYGGVELLDSAISAAQDYDPEVLRTVSKTCEPPGLLYSMQGPFGLEIFQATELIVIKMEYYDQVRVVFMNETDHPDDWPLSSLGHSIGHWEGDTLVVATARLKPGTLFNNGVDYSERLRVTERFRMSADGSDLIVTHEFEDPSVFVGKAARIMPLERIEGHVYPYECDPSYGLAIQSRDLDVAP